MCQALCNVITNHFIRLKQCAHFIRLEELNNLPIVALCGRNGSWMKLSDPQACVLITPTLTSFGLHSLVAPSKEGEVGWGSLGSQKARVNFGILFCPGLLCAKVPNADYEQLASLRRQINKTALYFLNFCFLWTHVHKVTIIPNLPRGTLSLLVRTWLSVIFYLCIFVYF